MTGPCFLWRLAAAILLGVPAVLAGLLAALYGGLQTDAGRRTVASLIEDNLATALETDAAVEGLAELSLDRIRLDRLVLGEPSNPWLAVETLDVVWRPLDLLAGKLSISSLLVDSLTLHRPPPDTGGSGEPLTAEDLRPPLAIAIDRFALNRLTLGAPVLGEAATLEIDGEATAGEDGNGLLRLDVTRRDGPGGQFSARADYGLATRKLDLGLSLAEPPNGVLAGLLDLPGRPAVSLKLDGAGSLDRWQGRLAGGADGLMSLDTAVELTVGDRLGFTLDGKADVAGLLPAEVGGLAEPEVSVALEGSWDTETSRLAIDAGRIATPALEGTLSGTLDAQTLGAEARLALRLLDASALAGLTAPLTLRTAETVITIDGPLTGPSGHVEARLASPAVPGAAAASAEVAADFEISDAAGELMTLRGTGRLAGVTTDDTRLNDLLGKEVTLEAEARIGSGGDVEIPSARVRAAAAQAGLSGSVTAEGTVDLAGTLEMPDLARLQDFAGMPLAGQGSASVVLRLDGGALRGTVAADVRDLALPAAGPAGELLGSEVALATEIRSDAAGNWRFENIALDGRRLSASGHADLLKDLTELDADYRLRVSDLSPLSGPAGVQIGGEASVTGTAAGPLAAPVVKGRVEAALRTPWDSATLGANATLSDLDRLALRDITVNTLGTTISGKLDIDLTTTLATGTLQATAEDLAAWAPLTGTPLAGKAKADITLTAPSGRQDLRLDLTASALGIAAAAEARALTATAVLADVSGTPRLDATARLDDVALPDFRLDGIDARARGPLDRLDVGLTAKGPSLSVDTAGTVSVGDALDLELTKLAGTAFGQDFALDGPASLRRAGDRLSVSGLRLRTGDGLIETDLDLTPEAVALDGRLSNLPLSLLALVTGDVDFAGTLDGEVHLSGTPAAPNGRLALSTNQATVTVGGEALALRVAADGILEAGTLAVTGSVEGPQQARLTAEGRLPVRLSAAPLDFALPPDRPLSATVKGRGDLAALVGPVLGEPHVLTGPLDLQMELSGTLAAPNAVGDLRIDGGRYENITTGTLLRDIGLEARFNGDALEIVRAGATAGEGRLDASGSAGLAAADGLPLDFRIRAEKAGVVRRDDLSLTVSGDLAIAGTAATPRVSGAMTVDDAELRLVDQTPPQVTTLDVVEVNAPARKAAEPKPSSGGGDVLLDLTIDVPNRLFVRGKGLDSEWSGNLAITGSTAEPEINGSLTPVRGQVSFAGKTFVLQKGSTVAFRTPGSTTPVLDLAAEYQGSDFTARFVIRGPADDPELTLTSSPELPQDEILSRILFGRGVARISAIEAAQLAQAVASLSGGGGPDFLETARRALGVDVLRIEGGEDTGPAVTAGRYLSKDVYVGVSQGAGAKSGQARVEVEVTPNVTIETEVGPTSGGEIGARWKLDY